MNPLDVASSNMPRLRQRANTHQLAQLLQITFLHKSPTPNSHSSSLFSSSPALLYTLVKRSFLSFFLPLQISRKLKYTSYGTCASAIFAVLLESCWPNSIQSVQHASALCLRYLRPRRYAWRSGRGYLDSRTVPVSYPALAWHPS